MKTLTIAFLFRDKKILLAMKKRKFGEGKWNGYGGKLEGDETPIEGIIREVEEESGLKIPKDKFIELGYMDYSFEDKPEWNQRDIIYKVEDFVGEPKETEEMNPKWFSLEEIPYYEMWKGDEKWLPYIIDGKKINGEIHFGESGEKLLRCDVREIKDEKTNEIKMK